MSKGCLTKHLGVTSAHLLSQTSLKEKKFTQLIEFHFKDHNKQTLRSQFIWIFLLLMTVLLS